MREILLAIISGFVIGIIAGLLGVGGGEFRLPILLGFLNLSVFAALPTNLIIGMIISTVSFTRRFTMMTMSSALVAALMIVSSIIGSYFGAFLVGKVKEKFIHAALILFLTIIGLKFTLAPFVNISLPTLNLSENLMLVVLFIGGFFIGILSGLFGVAGGELRIPFLMYISDLSIKLAGTINAFVSIFSQATGLIKHWKINKITKKYVIIALFMGLASLLGSFIGASLVFYVDEKILSFLLGLVLLTATSITFMKVKKGERGKHDE